MTRLLKSIDSLLLVVDVQKKLAPAVHDIDLVVGNIQKLVKVATVLEVPVIYTEHCADKIGHTINDLSTLIPKENIVNKRYFSALSEKLIVQRLMELNRKQVIVTGTEAHVCVMQTVIDFKRAGSEPYVVADAISSRRQLNKIFAIERMRQLDISIVTTEMVFFEWMERGDSREFRELLPLFK